MTLITGHYHQTYFSNMKVQFMALNHNTGCYERVPEGRIVRGGGVFYSLRD